MQTLSDGRSWAWIPSKAFERSSASLQIGRQSMCLSGGHVGEELTDWSLEARAVVLVRRMAYLDDRVAALAWRVETRALRPSSKPQTDESRSDIDGH